MTRGESTRVGALIKARFGSRATIVRGRNFDLSVMIRFSDDTVMVLGIDKTDSMLLTIALNWN